MGKLDGPSRQVLALLPNSHPIVSGHGIAKRSDAKAKARTGAKSLPTWRYISFKNAARRDGLELQRWVKGFRDANGRIKDAEDGDFYFARFNQKVRHACMRVHALALFAGTLARMHALVHSHSRAHCACKVSAINRPAIPAHGYPAQRAFVLPFTGLVLRSRCFATHQMSMRSL